MYVSIINCNCHNFKSAIIKFFSILLTVIPGQLARGNAEYA